jgi:hypothetical protein
MKTKLNGLILIITLLIISSCKTETSVFTSICILIDVTDEKFNDTSYLPDNISSILNLMQIDKENGGFSGGEVKFSLINDISDSKSKTVVINKAKPGLLGQNPLIRKDEVEKFCIELENTFRNTVNQANWGTNESKIYQKVTRELNKLTQTQCDKKIMIIYSDMLENSNLFNFYHTNWKKEIENYINKPEEAILQFSKKSLNMADLNGIDIYIITNRTVENDEKINMSERFWSTIFNHLGATTRFSSVLE